MKLLLGAGKADGGLVDEWAEQKGERGVQPFLRSSQRHRMDGGWAGELRATCSCLFLEACSGYAMQYLSYFLLCKGGMFMDGGHCCSARAVWGVQGRLETQNAVVGAEVPSLRLYGFLLFIL